MDDTLDEDAPRVWECLAASALALYTSKNKDHQSVKSSFRGLIAEKNQMKSLKIMTG